MPVYEYHCSNCDKKFEIFHKSMNSNEEIICPECKSKENKRVLSTFSASFAGSSGSSSFNDNSDSAPAGGCASGLCGLN